jgi:hypothetical protein
VDEPSLLGAATLAGDERHRTTGWWTRPDPGPAVVARRELVEEITRDLVILAPADVSRRASLRAVIEVAQDVVAEN